MRIRGKLTEVKVTRLTKPGRTNDGGGLYLQVSNVSGRPTQAWLFKFTSPLPHPSGRAKPWVREMGLGSISLYTLDEARERARQARQLVAAGLDPIEDRRAKKGAAKAAAIKATTFAQATAAYIKDNASTWRGGLNGHSASTWQQSLADFAFPVIGQLPVALIEKSHLIALLKPIWETKTVTAERVRGRIEAVLDYARGHGLRAGDNPATWKGNLDAVLPKPGKLTKVEHLKAMAYTDIPTFMAKLRTTEGVTARLIEFTVLTASRASEASGALWSEFDLDESLWTVPAKRMKADRDHRVPLAPSALAILKSLPRNGELVFESVVAKGRPISGPQVLKVLRAVAGDTPITLHGYRSTFKDWATDCTGTQKEIIEAALAHVIGDKTEEAYRRTDAIIKRGVLMDAWASYCGGEPAGAKVVAFKPAA
jgi:integrase